MSDTANIQSIAAPVVATELRRMAEEIKQRREVNVSTRFYNDGWFDGANMAIDALRARADELDLHGDAA
jgi:hypothetical protein